jgi:hypothetical protein
VSGEPFVSFVIIAYNEADHIAATLSAITSLADLPEHEVVVVNDGSRDGTADVVAEIARREPSVRLISLPENRGRGYARRTGIEAARGDLIATVDADIILPADWLIRARAALAGHDAVGGTAVPDGDAAYLCRRFALTPRVVGHTTAVSGSNALYRREVFGLLSFDPSLSEGEDVAFNHAATGQGLAFASVPGLLVQHMEYKSLREELRWRFVSGQGATRQLVTYRQVRTPDVAAGAFVGAVAAGLSLALRGRRAAGLSVPAALVLAVSAQHVRSRFETPWRQSGQLAPAVAADSLLLTAYFAGRLAGVPVLLRRGLRRTSPRDLRRPRPSGGHGQPVRVGRHRRDDHPALAGGGQDLAEQG